MTNSSFEPVYEGGVAVFRPSYEDFRDFRRYVQAIEPIGMTTGIVKVIPPQEWIEKLPKISKASLENIEVRRPIIQSINMNGQRGVYSIDNIEKKRKFSIEQCIKECGKLNNQPPVMRGERQKSLGQYDIDEHDELTYDDHDFKDPERLKDLENKYWKGLALGGAPMYGADLPGSLFDEKTTEWNVADLDNILTSLPTNVPGVNDAYLYCGMWRATFAWHLEDVDFPSINYIHFGAPKQWYSIPQSDHQKFYELMSAIWPDEQLHCSEFLRHKTFLVDPSFIAKHGIQVNRIVHFQQEFMITFPYGYHSGFNFGLNMAESVNFAHDSWLDIGLKAKKCSCVSHSVGIDVEQLIDSMQSHPRPSKTRKLDSETNKSVHVKSESANTNGISDKINGETNENTNSEPSSSIEPVSPSLATKESLKASQ